MIKIYNCSVINKYLFVGKHLLRTFLVMFERTFSEKLCKLM
jgi:hypothetical protein